MFWGQVRAKTIQRLVHVTLYGKDRTSTVICHAVRQRPYSNFTRHAVRRRPYSNVMYHVVRQKAVQRLEYLTLHGEKRVATLYATLYDKDRTPALHVTYFLRRKLSEWYTCSLSPSSTHIQNASVDPWNLSCQGHSTAFGTKQPKKPLQNILPYTYNSYGTPYGENRTVTLHVALYGKRPYILRLNTPR